MRKRLKRCQKNGNGLPPSVTFTRDPLNAYDDRAVPESLRASIRLANSANVWRSRTCGRLSACNTLLKRLEDLEDVAAELRQFVQKEDPVVRQRHFPRQRHLAAPDQAHLGDGVMGGATRACGDDGGAGAGEAGDAMDAGGLQRFGQAHRRQDGGQAGGE
jgi:hypothetical protein